MLQALDMLPAVKNAVGNLMPIFMDGGIRRGTDILKAGPLLLHPSMPRRLAAYNVDVRKVVRPWRQDFGCYPLAWQGEFHCLDHSATS